MTDAITTKKITDLPENTAAAAADLLVVGNAGTANLRKIKFSNLVGSVKKKIPAIEGGEVEITPSAANTPTAKAVTFSEPFTDVPVVTVTPVSSVPGTTILGAAVSAVTRTGCTVYVTRANTTQTSVNWIAVGPRA